MKDGSGSRYIFALFFVLFIYLGFNLYIKNNNYSSFFCYKHCLGALDEVYIKMNVLDNDKPIYCIMKYLFIF